ncbi:hypothetical protein acdb102_27750 [Acidothermaceae bacterium B102]|nr:hypothetical protein acdb102_27750 [Acidothermaceae bacterium B102]
MNLAALVLATTLTASPASVLFHLQDPRIDEASGVAVATRESGVLFTHNDSGDSARFFALGPTGRTLATYDVDGAANVDWEDMAEAPNRAHLPTLWLGDIGDNDAVRKNITVYATPEPRVALTGPSRTVHVRAVAYRLRYPDGPHNAESLLVDPRSAQVYVATKSYLGDTDVYAAPAHLSATKVNVLRRVASLHWSAVHPATSVEAVAAQLATTGGAFSPDGRTVVLRTYTDAYLFIVAAAGPAAMTKALNAAPRRIALPAQPQGEGVAFTRDGTALVLTSEHKGSAVDRVPIPAVAVAPTSAAPSTVGPASADPAPAVTSRAATAASPVPPSAGHRSAWPAVVGGVAAAGVLAAGAWVWRRNGPAA